jgi:hypothetical protein
VEATCEAAAAAAKGKYSTSTVIELFRNQNASSLLEYGANDLIGATKMCYAIS